ncbi:MAG: M6 family metalloprotease domain-containing protein [Bacteroidaceae bacterium]|nr:M6 family metalloprotease domain-containing protein [Bacteroidaceae bacterium]
MKKLMILAVCLAAAVTLYAVPAKRGVTYTVQQPDGTTLTLLLRGDGNFHYYTKADGTPMRENEQGEWVVDTRNIKALWEEARAKRSVHRRQLAQKTRKLFATRAQKKKVGEGKRKGLLILVNFADKAMVNGAASKAIFERELNGLDDPYNGNYGSVREYFRAQSYGKLDIEFDVVGPVTLSREMSYYGKDSGGEGNDAHADEMILEAVRLADSEVNYADYDWDGDGEVENIYVTYAGYSQAQGASTNTIWPHQASLGELLGTWSYDYWTGEWILKKEYVLMLDGVRINTYATGSELVGVSGTKLDGIGTMCHEYSHCLGLPDFYDTEYSGNFGMNSWSLMDYGSYNGNGYTPAGYTAYERWYCGWLEPTELYEPTTITGMPCIEEEPVAYVIYNDANPDEYYLLANHQQKGWNRSQGGKGLMILHVDYDEDVWARNTVNNTTDHQRMTIIPADNSLTTHTVARDLWPYSTRKALTDTSTPSATLFHPNTDGEKLMHKPIENIKLTSGLISFDFMGGQPAIEDVTAIEDLPVAPVQHSGNSSAYDLTGRRVERPTKGLYIINGKKYYIK